MRIGINWGFIAMLQALELRKPPIEDRGDTGSFNRMAEDIRRGLEAEQKYLSSKYFYDARGSLLFEKICRLPEYYLTRTELAILREAATKLTRGFHDGDIVELGSGANRKIRALLDAMGNSRRASIRYIPMDVSADALEAAAKGLLCLYPELEVVALVADFTCELHRMPSKRPKIIMFLGSTIGNLNEEETGRFLGQVSDNMHPGDRFLLGLDMVKPVQILEAAYNDSQHTTAAFNKNILLVLNRETGADFHPEDFEHVAFFNEEFSQIEMHLRANRRVAVHFAHLDWSIVIERGETVRTEISRKFTRPQAEKFVEQAGMMVDAWHSDPRGWFSIAQIVSQRG